MSAPDAVRAEVRPIAARETHPLRQAVLRPHQALDQVGFAGDEAADTLHAGAFLGAALIAVATVCREAPGGSTAPDSWRLRGMASDPRERRRGHGRALVRACLEHARKHGARQFWCHARVSAAEFYRALGFEVRGEMFVLPEIGPHLFMELPALELRPQP